MKQILCLVFCLLLAAPLRGTDTETAEKEMQALRSRCAAAEKELDRMVENKTGLAEYFRLIAELERLESDLARLESFLDRLSRDAQKRLPDFQITAHRNDFNGPPVDGPFRSGDILACTAEVTHPEPPEGPKPTELYWQLYDPQQKPITGVTKRVQAYESGTTLTYRFRFRINSLPPGTYTVGLTHYRVDDHNVRSQAAYEFRVAKAPGVRIRKLLVTEKPGGAVHCSVLGNQALPHCYVLYETDEKTPVTIFIRITAKGSGEAFFEKEYTRDPAGKNGSGQKFGIRLDQGVVPLNRTVFFEAKLTIPDSPESAVRRVAFKQRFYELKIKAPNRLKSNTPGRFTLTVPDRFTPPFTTELTPSPGLALHYEKDALTGTVTGISESGTQKTVLRAGVTDSRGRIAKGSVTITIAGLFEEKPDPDKLSVVPGAAEWKKSNRLYVRPEKSEEETATSRKEHPPAVQSGQVQWYDLSEYDAEEEGAKGATGRFQAYIKKGWGRVKHGKYIVKDRKDRVAFQAVYKHGKLWEYSDYTLYKGKKYLAETLKRPTAGWKTYTDYHIPEGTKYWEQSYRENDPENTYQYQWWLPSGAREGISAGSENAFEYHIFFNASTDREEDTSSASISKAIPFNQNGATEKDISYNYEYPSFQSEKDAIEKAFSDMKSNNKQYLTYESVRTYCFIEKDGQREIKTIDHFTNVYKKGRHVETQIHYKNGKKVYEKSKTRMDVNDADRGLKRFSRLQKEIQSMVPEDLPDIKKGLARTFSKKTENRKLMARLGHMTEIQVRQWEREQFTSLARILVNTARAGRTTALDPAALWRKGLITLDKFNEISRAIRENKVRNHFEPGIKRFLSAAQRKTTSGRKKAEIGRASCRERVCHRV